MAFDVEQLFQSIDIILTQRLQDVQFDKTIICTIVDDSDKKNGCYIVSDGTIKFKAYVSDATYRKDDQVRVSILNGDFSEKKFITGRYTRDEETVPITYKSPLESIIPITGNLVTKTKNHTNGVNGLKANSNTTQIELWRADLTSDTEFRDLQSNGIYNTLTIKADFKTLLSKYDLISGNYGLRLDLFIQPSFDNPTQRIRKYVTLDSSEMMGNPYSFSVYSTQAKKVNIVSTGVIAEMVLWLYQSINGDGEGRRFIEKDGNEIPVNPIADDILVKNIEIGFGSDIEQVTDNTLEIFTSSPPYYVYQNPSDISNKKEIELLWYNKTDDNKYIGFSDGLFDLEYDEIEYLKLSNQNARLCAQLGRTDIPNDEIGLKLAADLKDAKPIMIKARDALTNEVANVLYRLQRQVKSTSIEEQLSDRLLDTAQGALVRQWNNANTALENWNISYSEILQYAYNKQNNIENPEGWKEQWNVDYYKEYTDAIRNGIEEINMFFIDFDKWTLPSAEGYLSAHRGNYDLYLYHITNEISIIENYLNQIEDLLNENFNKLKEYKKSKYKFYPYKERDFSLYANKYCVYWYQYERSYKLEYKKDANNDEYNFGKFVSDGWRRLGTDEVIQNLGLPRTKNPVNEKYYPAKALGQVLSRTMDRNKTEEKYMAVLFHNHEMYKSNIITFTNSEPELIPNEALIDKKDALKIEHDVASFEHYQAYNEFNMLRSLEDGGKIRQLKCYYDGLFRKDEALINAGLYWYIPNHSTMLTFDKDDLLKEGFSTDDGITTEYSIPGYTYFYKKISQCEDKDKLQDENGDLYYTCRDEDRYFFYKIKPQLEKDAQNNTILVKAYLEGVNDPVEGEITMTFSTFGTNGSKYTLSIVPSGSKVSIGTDGEEKPLSLSVTLKDSQNNPIDIVDQTFIHQTDIAYGFTVEAWNKSPNAFSWSYIYKDGVQNNKTAPIVGLQVFLSTETIAQWPEGIPYFGIINAKVNFQIDAKNNTDTADKKICDKYQKYRVLDLNTLYPITYSASNKYYMSGATYISYNNQGVVSYVSEDQYQLYTINDKGNTPVPNQTWKIMYYKINAAGLPQAATENDLKTLRNYMPVLNSENRLTPAPLYIADIEYIPVVICTVKNENDTEDIAWVQPIIITQNRYASSTLNDWNGSFTIDEKNGTILATALGAGKKEADNSFSGVLMGDIGTGANFDTDNMSGLGLYGFNQGAQSFCLSVDGKAFFGKAGRGRIYFDGDSGTISSASYQQNRIPKLDNEDQFIGYEKSSVAGMMIDLDDGFIDMQGAISKADGSYAQDLYYDADEDQYGQAKIHIDVKDPYFYIRSAQQLKNDHYLIHIGKDNYYLQTDDYKTTIFNLDDNRTNDNGAGFKLDLKKGGILDGYNFKLSSKNIFINSADSTKPFFVTKNDEGKNLLYIGNDEYYLQSSDYQKATNSTFGSGLRLNLMRIGTTNRTGIIAYNFELSAGEAGTQNGKIKPAIILSDSGNPYFQINTLNSASETVTLLDIKKTANDFDFNFQSLDYVQNSAGMRLSFSENKMEAYSGFLLKAYKTGSTTDYISINANATENPLQIASKFEVDWAGNLSCEGMTAENAKLTGTLDVDDTLTVSGVLKGGTIEGATIQGGVLKVGKVSGTTYQLYADSDGVTIQNATIINCSIQNGDGASNGSGGFGVTSNGVMTGYGCSLTDGKFITCTVEELLTCNGDISLSGRNMLYFGDKGAYLSFSDQSLNTNASFYVSGTKLACKTIGCNKIEGSAYVAPNEGGDITVAANLDAEGHSIIATAITVKGTLWIGTDTLEQYIKNIVKNSISVSVASNADDTTVSGGTNGVYTVTTTDNKTVTASQTICCYTYTQPSGGYFTTTETTGDPPSGSYYTYCTRDKSETKDISTSGTIKATITVKD